MRRNEASAGTTRNHRAAPRRHAPTRVSLFQLCVRTTRYLRTGLPALWSYVALARSVHGRQGLMRFVGRVVYIDQQEQRFCVAWRSGEDPPEYVSPSTDTYELLDCDPGVDVMPYVSAHESRRQSLGVTSHSKRITTVQAQRLHNGLVCVSRQGPRDEGVSVVVCRIPLV